MFFHHLLLRRFGLNALDFSETTDFLMIVVREPLTVALALLGVPFYIVYGNTVVKVGGWLQRVFPRLKRSPAQRRQSLETTRRWGPWLQVAFILTYALLFLMLYSTWRANRIKAGNFRPLIVEYKTDSPRVDGSQRSDHLALLGTTSRFAFLYDPTARRTEVVPLDSIARLSWDGRTRREQEADEKAARPTPAANPPASSPLPAAAPAAAPQPTAPTSPAG
ncbi:hypothetical protein Verru16b_00183 [Lacunisphaera limnophila]|nr:hypothetical protein [Lacunisphaera limnophila]AOS43142.1 hypothetical protein Verru16b_00183 [Lacunisphaera limnophila]